MTAIDARVYRLACHRRSMGLPAARWRHGNPRLRCSVFQSRADYRRRSDVGTPHVSCSRQVRCALTAFRYGCENLRKKMQPHATNPSNLVRAGQCRSTARSAPNAPLADDWLRLLPIGNMRNSGDKHFRRKLGAAPARPRNRLWRPPALLAHATEVVSRPLTSAFRTSRRFAALRIWPLSGHNEHRESRATFSDIFCAPKHTPSKHKYK
jgi:hypothetical protein